MVKEQRVIKRRKEFFFFYCLPFLIECARSSYGQMLSSSLVSHVDLLFGPLLYNQYVYKETFHPCILYPFQYVPTKRTSVVGLTSNIRWHWTHRLNGRWFPLTSICTIYLNYVISVILFVTTKQKTVVYLHVRNSISSFPRLKSKQGSGEVHLPQRHSGRYFKWHNIVWRVKDSHSWVRYLVLLQQDRRFYHSGVT